MTVTVEVGPELEKVIKEKLRKGEFRTAHDLVQQALSRFIDEQSEIAHTEALLEEAANSGDYIELTETEWDKIERDAVGEVEKRTAKPD